MDDGLDISFGICDSESIFHCSVSVMDQLHIEKHEPDSHSSRNLLPSPIPSSASESSNLNTILPAAENDADDNVEESNDDGCLDEQNDSGIAGNTLNFTFPHQIVHYFTQEYLQT